MIESLLFSNRLHGSLDFAGRGEMAFHAVILQEFLHDFLGTSKGIVFEFHFIIRFARIGVAVNRKQPPFVFHVDAFGG